ncbi:hypothetical protein [Tabrizicola soli]|uniref:HEAT repeat domain-containing protein n=1 Tax=Tabrizicola soli TaxID=2185115 RepID=A0ABV7DTH6_9RHOB|nr:hypothetical protein [Tabrizicola soli]
MIRLACLFLLSLTLPALAETASIRSGEHDGFTRLVVELPSASGWTLGRTPMGYGFAFAGPSQPDYELGRVWDLIPRTRLQALRVEPGSGALQLSLACDCHVLPFEYRPGVIVLDIKDGPAPAGSGFEQPFDPGSAEAVPAPQAEATGYDWLSDLPGTAGSTNSPLDLPELATGAVSLEPLRDQLLAEISRGAAEGVVDMELPGKPPKVADAALEDLPGSHVHIGELPGVAASLGGGSTEPAILAECAPGEMLDLPAWGEGQSALDLLAGGRSGFYGEFDAVKTDAVLESVRRHLFLGFGAEARQYAALVPTAEAPPELAWYQSMSRLVEGESDPTTPFAKMLPCDGPAALWAAFALDRLPQGRDVNVAAIQRGFLALPPHLRTALGAGLAEKMLARGDGDAARLIRDSMERAPFADAGAIALLDAKVDLHAERPEAARDHAAAAVAEAGADIAPLITLVDTHLPQAEPLSPEVADSLAAVLGESDGRPDEPSIRRALVLALALSGQTAAAFDASEGTAPPELWQIAGRLARDDDFLAHAVLAADQDPPGIAPEVRGQIARRLLDLGFADPALQWLGPLGPEAAAGDRLLAAEGELARGDARAALALLSGLDLPEARTLRGRAHVQLGDFAPARALLMAAGEAEEAARLRTWTRDWPGLSAEGDAPWKAAATLVVAPDPEAEGGLLARGTRLAEEGTRARAAVAALLAAVPSPVAP